jgi:two-component system sensor histidine kinase DegS
MGYDLNMQIDNQTRKQEDQVFVSVQLYRRRRRKQKEINTQNTPISREIEELRHQKIVRELHDGLTQTVSALAMRINFARRLLSSDPAAVQDELEKVEDLVRDSTREIRHMIFILRPFPKDEFELVAALDMLAEKMAELFGLEIDLAVNDDLVNHMPLIHQRVIYAIVEEAVDNARKQNGTSIVVRLERLDQQVLELEIEALEEITPENERPFQRQEFDNIQKYCGLIKASVKVEGDGTRIQVLLPVFENTNDGSPSRS